jgi:hypothetical protein
MINLQWRRRAGRFLNHGITTLEAVVLDTQDIEGKTVEQEMSKLGDIRETQLANPKAQFWFWQKAHHNLDRLSFDSFTCNRLISEMAKVVPYAGRS